MPHRGERSGRVGDNLWNYLGFSLQEPLSYYTVILSIDNMKLIIIVVCFLFYVLIPLTMNVFS